MWVNIPTTVSSENWMEATPTDYELDTRLSKLKTQRAPGEGGFVAETLKYGGEDLRSRVCEVVRQMWDKARTEENGK